MSYRTDRRRRLIRGLGRTMLLMRASGDRSVSIQGYAPPPQAAQLSDDMPQAAFIRQITNDELASSAFGRPRNTDRIKDGDSTYTLTDARPVFDGQDVAGWTLIAEGGEITA